jgi:membrane associated rhomboid family serine protease
MTVPSGYPQVQTVCTWHPDRATGLACTRCGRPACTECLTPASVGFHCRQCVAEARGSVRPARTVSGGIWGRNQPVVTYALIAINIVVFVATLVAGGGEGGITSTAIVDEGALTPMFAASGSWWQFLTNGFLHASTLHVAMNMLSLYFVGAALERSLGPLRFAVVYFVSLFGASVAVFLLAPLNSSAVGASGAVFGVLGALVVTLKRLRMDLRQLSVLIAINLVITFTVPQISWQGHLGGLVVGAVVGALMVYPPQTVRAKWQVGGTLALLALLVGAVIVRDTAIGPLVCDAVRCFRLNT